MTALTQARLKELLHYCPESGRWTRLVTRCSQAQAGQVAGCLRPDGYWRIKVDGRLYRAHRLAFLYMVGAWPAAEVDHIDGDKSNNRFANLREATCAQNMRNRRATRSNTSGFKGVSWAVRRQKWLAQIRAPGRQIYLGYFDTPEAAHAAYCAAAHHYHGQFARTA